MNSTSKAILESLKTAPSPERGLGVRGSCCICVCTVHTIAEGAWTLSVLQLCFLREMCDRAGYIGMMPGMTSLSFSRDQGKGRRGFLSWKGQASVSPASSFLIFQIIVNIYSCFHLIDTFVLALCNYRYCKLLWHTLFLAVLAIEVFWVRNNSS